jgi:hypothetical protein
MIMQSFRQYLLKEQANNDFDFWPEEDIIDWITRNGHRVLKKYNIEDLDPGNFENAKYDYGIVNATAVLLSGDEECLPRINGSTHLRYLPCQFGHIERNFFIANCSLGSLKGCPKIVGGRFSISNNPEITSLDYFPERASSYILRGTGITSLSGIHKVIKEIRPNRQGDGEIVVPHTLTNSILGLLKIPGLRTISYPATERAKYSNELRQAIGIVYNHLQTDEKNAIACQRELIENNLDDYAEF